MAKTFVAQKVTSVNPLHFERKGDIVTGLIVDCEVSYGEIGMSHRVDVWGELTQAQRDTAQQFYEFIQRKIESIILE